MIIDEIMVVQKQNMQKHVRIPETTCSFVVHRMIILLKKKKILHSKSYL